MVPVMKFLGITEFLPPNKMSSWAVSSICSVLTSICDNFYKFFASTDTSLNNKERYPVILGHYPCKTFTLFYYIINIESVYSLSI